MLLLLDVSLGDSVRTLLPRRLEKSGRSGEKRPGSPPYEPEVQADWFTAVSASKAMNACGPGTAVFVATATAVPCSAS